MQARIWTRKPAEPAARSIRPRPSRSRIRPTRTFYPRYFNTPNQQVICRKLAALEQGGAALVFGPGMAAICTVTPACLKPGEVWIWRQWPSWGGGMGS